MTEVIPYLMYRDVPAALAWLTSAFGFREDQRVPSPKGMHAEMSLDGRRIMMGQSSDGAEMAPPERGRPISVGIFVYVPELAAHYDRANAAGAQIDNPPADHGYGMTYTARDLDGHLWFFTQAE